MVGKATHEAFKKGIEHFRTFVSKHVGYGWYIVLLSPVQLDRYNTDIQPWIKENIQGKTEKNSFVLFFELKEDELLFKLRWS